MYHFLRPLFFQLDPERAHQVGTGTARLAQAVAPVVVEHVYAYADAGLHQTLWETLAFRNPVGLAAGYDKNARLVPFWENLGFGFAEVGSVTAQPARGNPRPRAFRLPEDHALINRIGLSNEGAARVARRLKNARKRFSMPVGVNLAKTPRADLHGAAAVDDFCQSFRQLAPLADYVTINISCPNTADGKTFEEPDALDQLLAALFDARAQLGLRVPVLLKLAPSLNERVVYDSLVEGVLDVASRYDVRGYVACNTAPDRLNLKTPPDVVAQMGAGGLSGAPLRGRSTRLVQYLYRRTEGRVPIIGVGGILSAEDAYAKIRAGASLVQLYTGLVYEGPGLVKQIKKGLAQLLERDGFSKIGEAVGLDAR